MARVDVIDATPPNPPLLEDAQSENRSPWAWIPSLYFAEGIPNVIVMTVAVIMFKRMGVGNAQIALFTSWLYLPYALKPLWSPLVQRFGTRRGWVVSTQLLIALGLATAAAVIPLHQFVFYTLMTLAVVAVLSATHDVAADGFYMLPLSGHEQTWFVGIRNTSYRLATIVGQGLLVMFAGYLESATGLPPVQIEVSAADHPVAQSQFDPAQLLIDNTKSQHVVIAGEAVKLSLAGKRAEEIDLLVEQVRAWNTAQHFYESLSAQEKLDAETNPTSQGLRVVLENWIRRRFGAQPVDNSSGRTGDAAAILIRLARPMSSGETQVVQLGRSGGDPSFKVIEGERFVVTDRNWDRPFAAVVQVEEKLNRPSHAEFQIRSGNIALSWMATFFIAAGLFFVLCIYHFFALPRPALDRPAISLTGSEIDNFIGPFVAFFRKPKIVVLIAFLLLYRLPESQAVKLVQPFLLDPREKGGLALTTGEVGLVYGTIGIAMLMMGGILGGLVAARDGLKRWLWPMVLAIHLPNLALLLLAYLQPESRWAITLGVAVEQFGYGFGFTAYMLYCLYISRGQYQTVHYAICTGFMALGLMIPGMWSGWLEELVGYQHFFAWIMISTIPSFLAVAMIPLDADFGRKSVASLVAKGRLT